MNFLKKGYHLLGFKSLASIWKKSSDDLIFVHAASLTYSTFLNFIPIFALAYYFFDFVGGFEHLQNETQEFFSEYLAPQFAEEMISYLDIIRIRINPKALGVFGVIGFIASGILLLSKIEFSLNAMWSFPKKRSWIQKVTTYWTILSLGPIFLGFSFVVLKKTVGSVSADQTWVSVFLKTLLVVLPYITTGILFSAIYLWLPAVRIPWRAAFFGGVVASLLFEGLKQIYAVYAVYALKNSIYGTLAVLPIFMIWVNLLWVIVLLGAQFSYFYVKNVKKKT